MYTKEAVLTMLSSIAETMTYDDKDAEELVQAGLNKINEVANEINNQIKET